MTDKELKELRELAYGMSVANLNPEDVTDYMAIATACARMESRRAAYRATIGLDRKGEADAETQTPIS